MMSIDINLIGKEYGIMKKQYCKPALRIYGMREILSSVVRPCNYWIDDSASCYMG